MPSGHKAFLVHNIHDVDVLLMHNRTYAAEYVLLLIIFCHLGSLTMRRIAHAVSARKRVEIIGRAKQLGVKVTNAKAKVTVES
jgi:ribosomal protein L32E